MTLKDEIELSKLMVEEPIFNEWVKECLVSSSQTFALIIAAISLTYF